MEKIPEEAEKTLDNLADRGVDSTDTNARYAAYGSRLITALRTSSRYVAYTSDVGEAFRPVVAPYIVKTAYLISWTYVTGDVAYETWKAHRRGPTPLEAATFNEPTRLGMTAVQRSLFQGIASMGLPALTIHTTVKYASRAFKNAKTPRVKAWGPTVTGLAVVPVLPYIFDKPVENATEWAFKWIEERIRESTPTAKKTDL